MPNGKAEKARRSSKGGGGGGGYQSLVLFIAGLSNGFSIPQPSAESPCLPAVHLSRSTPHILLLLTFPSRGGVDVTRESRQRGASDAGAPAAGLRMAPRLPATGLGRRRPHAGARHHRAAGRGWINAAAEKTHTNPDRSRGLFPLASSCLFSPSTLLVR